MPRGKNWTAKESKEFVRDKISGMRNWQLAQKYNRSKSSIISHWNNRYRYFVWDWEEIKRIVRKNHGTQTGSE